MVTRSPRIFTGLENLRIDPKLGLVMKQRTLKTPYSAPDPLDRESTVYVSRMPQRYRDIRYKLLRPEMFEPELEGLLRFDQQTLALAMPEWFGLPVPTTYDYPEDYEPPWFRQWFAEGAGPQRALVAAGLQQQIVGTRRAEAAVQKAREAAQYGFLPFAGAQRVPIDPVTLQPIPPTEFQTEAERSYWLGETTGLPQGGSLAQQQWLRQVSAAGAAPEGWAQSDWTNYVAGLGATPQRVLDITTITADMLADVPGLKEGMKVARLSTGEMIPVPDYIADAWTGELPSAEVLSALPPGAVFLGIDGEGNVSYLPAAGRLNVYGLQRKAVEVQVEGLGAFTTEDIERFEGFELLTLEPDQLSDDEIEAARRWVMASPVNALEYTMLMRSIGRNEQTEELIRRMAGKPVSYDEMSGIFGEVPAAAPEPAVGPGFPGQDLVSQLGQGRVIQQGIGETANLVARTLYKGLVNYISQTKRGLLTDARTMFPDIEPLPVDDETLTPNERAARASINLRRARLSESNKELRANFSRLQFQETGKHEEWLKKHPELQAPEGYEAITDPKEWLRKAATDPKFLPWAITSQMMPTIAALGAASAVGLATGNPLLAAGAAYAAFQPMQVQDVADDLTAAGAPEELVDQLAVQVGSLISTLDLVGELPLLSVIPGPFRALGRTFRRGAQKAVVDATMGALWKKGLTTFTAIQFSETLTEVAQNALQNYTVSFFDKNRHTLDNTGVTILQVMAQTSVFAGAGSYMGMRQQLQENKALALEAGVPEDWANVEALNQLAVTPEGEAALTELTNQMVDESAKGTLNTFIQRLISEERGAIGKPAEVRRTLASPEATAKLKAAQEQGKQIGLDVEAIQGIAPDEYWVSISANKNLGEAFLKWEGKVTKTNEELNALAKALEGKIWTQRRGEVKPAKGGFLPFKNIENAQKFLATGDLSLIAKTIELRGELMTPERLAETREALAAQDERLRPIREQLKVIDEKIKAKQEELDTTWEKTDISLDERKAIRSRLDDEIRQLEAQATDLNMQMLQAQPTAAFGRLAKQFPQIEAKAVPPAEKVEAPAVEAPIVKEAIVEPAVAEALAPGEAEVTLARPPEAVPEEAIPPPVPPEKPPEGAISEPVPPVEPVIPEIDRIIEQSQKQVEQDAPRALVRMFHAIPGLKQIMEFERPALKMTGDNQKVVAALVAEQAARADVATRSMSTRLPLLKRLADTFGKDVLRGKAKSAVEFLGSEDQKKSILTGTLKDIVDNPDLYSLSYEQANLIGDIQERNDATLDWVVSGYNAEIGRYTPKGAGAWLPNVDISEDVVEYLGSETRAVVSGRGKTRVWATARDRLEHDASFVPELDVQKLLEGADSFKASAAGGQTYRQTIGGLTRLEAIEKTHPKLYERMVALRKKLSSLQGSAGTIESNVHKGIYEFLHSSVEDTDLDALRDTLDVKLKTGPRKGFDVVKVQEEMAAVRDEIKALQPAWQAANLKPYVFVKDLYRYFPGDQAKLIVESRQVSNSPLLKFVERWRAGAFSGDLSPFAIQGSLGVLADPYGAIKVGVGSARSAMEAQDFLRSYKVEALAEDIAANPDEWAQYASLSGRQLAGTPQEYAAGFLSLIPGASRFTEATYLTVTRQSFNLWRRTADSLAKNGVPELDAKIVAMEVADKVYPLINPKRLGQSEARTSFIRALPTSYSFIRQPMSMIAEASTGYAKLIAFQKLSPKELMAVKIVTTMAASVMAASVASAAISAIGRGEDDDKVWQAIKDALNPDPYNGKFAAIIIGDTRIPIGGPYRAIFRALYPQDVKGVPFPVPFASLGRYFANRITPALSTQVDLVRNRDYWGRTILKGNVPEQIVRGLEYELENMLPLTAGGFVESLRTKREKDEMVREVIGQFMGVNPVKLDNTYLFKQERKLGTEKLEPPPEFSSKRPIYDVGDYWGDTNRLIRDIPTEHIGRRNFPQSVKAIAEARDILDESVNVLPNRNIVSINADPQKGDTFVQFFNQWTQRKTLKEGELDEFDRKYPQSELGNITLRQFDLLREYHRLPDKDKQAQFLKDHPELTQNPRQEWLRSHPEDNAKLAIWGQAKPLTKEAYDKTLALAKSYDIPDSALPLSLPPKEVADAFFERQKLRETFASGSLEVQLFDIDNSGLTTWRRKVNPKLGPVEVKSLEGAKLIVNNRALQAERDALRGKDAMETDKLRADFDAKHVEFTKDRLRVEGYDKAVPGNLIEDYVASKQVERRGFEDEWFWLEHPDLYRFMTSGAKPLMTQKDFSKVPTREVGRLWDEYEDIQEAKAKLAFRIKHPDLDAWLVKAKAYTPAEARERKAKAPAVPSFRMRGAAPRAAAVRRPAVAPRPAPQPVAAPPPAQRQPRIVLPSRSRGRAPTAALRRRGLLR